MALTDIDGREEVYRRLLPESGHYSGADGGPWSVSYKGFSDLNEMPSVDLSAICRGLVPSGPFWTQGGAENAVVSILVNDIRVIGSVEKKKNEKVLFTYSVDVYRDPREKDGTEPANPAHAEIRTVRAYPTTQWGGAGAR